MFAATLLGPLRHPSPPFTLIEKFGNLICLFFNHECNHESTLSKMVKCNYQPNLYDFKSQVSLIFAGDF